MEMNTSEMTRRKAALKSKLMAALSLLLVSTIMLGTATYAWFVLSTAPEVTGMSTSVGSNGSLEIALQSSNDEGGRAAIETGFSYVNADVEVEDANKTWGNIVDLSSVDYHFDQYTLYPARLNWTDTDGAKTVSVNTPLVGPSYGVDGRIATLNKTLSAKTYTDNGYQDRTYGVNGIGSFAEAANTENTMTRAALASYAQNRMNRNANQVKAAFDSSIDVATLMTLESAEETLTASQTSSIKKMIDSVGTANEKARLSLAYALLGERASDTSYTFPADTTPSALYGTYESMTAAEIKAAATAGSALYNAAAKLEENITLVENALSTLAVGADGTATKENAKAAVSILMDRSKALLAGRPLNTLSSSDISSITDDMNMYLCNDTGAVANLAYIVGDFTFATPSPFIVNVYVTSAIPSADWSASNRGYSAANTGYIGQISINTSVAGDAFTYTISGYSGTTYAYSVDLAFRSNAGGSLLLQQAPAVRVSDATGDDLVNLMGSGSTVSFTGAGDQAAKLYDSIRVVFVNTNDGTLYGIANAGTDGTLTMCDVTYKADGSIAVEEADSQVIIPTMNANQEYYVTAIVFLDGDAFDGVTGNEGYDGTLSLQFATSATLTPMSYSGYVTGGTGSETGGTGGESGGTGG